MKKWMVCVSVVVALCFVAGSLFAAEGGDKPKTEKPKVMQVTGVVKSYTPGDKPDLPNLLSVTVKKEGAETEMIFQVVTAEGEGATKIMPKGKAPTDLTENTRVQVSYTKADDTLTAVIVKILPSEKPKPKG